MTHVSRIVNTNYKENVDADLVRSLRDANGSLSEVLAGRGRKEVHDACLQLLSDGSHHFPLVLRVAQESGIPSVIKLVETRFDLLKGRFDHYAAEVRSLLRSAAANGSKKQ